jgi:soluble lytic murein transglycosylase
VYNQAARQTIVDMIRAAREGRWSKARDLAAAAREPLAGAIYAWLVYDDSRDTVEFSKIETFLSTHPDWPHRKRMKLLAEKSLPPTLSDSRTLAFFKTEPPVTAPCMRLYVDALIRAKREKDARVTLEYWWRSTPLPASEQAEFLSRYGHLISKDSHRIRIDALLEAQGYTAARALAPHVGKGFESVVEVRIAIARGKPGVNALIDRIPTQYLHDPGLDYDRLVYRRRAEDNDAAITILNREPEAAKLSDPAAWWKERQIIARRLVEQGQARRAWMLVKGRGRASPETKAEAEWLAGWIAFKFLKKNPEAFLHFETLYNESASPLSRARAAYWAALVSRAMGRKDVAARWFEAAAVYQTAFYGQMAAASLPPGQVPPAPSDPVADVKARVAFGHDGLVQAARLFDAAGWHDRTALFLSALTERARTPQDYWLAADLAFDLGHVDGAVRIARKAGSKGIVLSEYAWPTQIARMRGVGLEWALVHALIRQESGFDSDARSSAGALGLMQLMPATAREVARREGISHRTDWLVRPDHNIRLGTAYFQELLERFDGSYALALAGYNAGPARVDRWIAQFGDPRDGSTDLAQWVERIPISETRNYVQRVLEGVYVYRIKLKDVQKRFNIPLHVAVNE